MSLEYSCKNKWYNMNTAIEKLLVNVFALLVTRENPSMVAPNGNSFRQLGAVEGRTAIWFAWTPCR
jgi:hypothetical protein